MECTTHTTIYLGFLGATVSISLTVIGVLVNRVKLLKRKVRNNTQNVSIPVIPAGYERIDRNHVEGAQGAGYQQGMSSVVRRENSGNSHKYSGPQIPEENDYLDML